MIEAQKNGVEYMRFWVNKAIMIPEIHPKFVDNVRNNWSSTSWSAEYQNSFFHFETTSE